MGALDGRVAIITGAGRGIGREHALLFASEGAKVVINDLGGAIDGSGDDRTPAQQVVDEIKGMGGEAVANADNVADWEGAQRLVNTAVETFGDLHVLVNNAGILRDRMLVNMTEEEFDSVVNVNLKGTFAVSHFAAGYWRERCKQGRDGGRGPPYHPRNISPLVAYLASSDCALNGHMFRVVGDLIGVYEGWHLVDSFENGKRWEIPGIAN